jgi:hypothetical protein
MVGAIELIHLTFRIVIDHDAQRSQHGQHAQRLVVEAFPNTVFKQGHIDQAVIFGHTDALAEIADRLGRITPSAHAR